MVRPRAGGGYCCIVLVSGHLPAPAAAGPPGRVAERASQSVGSDRKPDNTRVKTGAKGGDGGPVEGAEQIDEPEPEWRS